MRGGYGGYASGGGRLGPEAQRGAAEGDVAFREKGARQSVLPSGSLKELVDRHAHGARAAEERERVGPCGEWNGGLAVGMSGKSAGGMHT